MRSIRRFFPALRDTESTPESGMSLVELVVAMMVFAIIAMGVALTMVNVLVLTNDSRERVSATNLAAAEIDLARSYNDVFAVLDRTVTQTVGTTVFTITRSTSWVSNAGTDVSCSNAGGALQYKRVNVRVTWPLQKTDAAPVRADTILTPGSRINDPATGTILVSVKRASGSGYAGVTVTATPISGGGSITATIPVTDNDGCSYVLKVKPGTYSVKISKSASIDSAQSPTTPERIVTVKKGESSAASFAYDQSAGYSLAFAPTPAPTAALPGPLLRPTSLHIGFLSTYDPFVASVDNSATPSVKLFPWASGYQAIAGQYSAAETASPCTVVDPSAWGLDETVTPNRVGERAAAAAAVPGGTTTVTVPVGALTVRSNNLLFEEYLFATQLTTPSVAGEPACATSVTYAFGKVLPMLLSQKVTIALPFGSWKLYSGTASNGSNKVLVPDNRLEVLTGGVVNTATEVVCLDPRAAVAP